ncbi:MAG: PspC domain-containing protein, partial [Bacteroidota bacterium]
MNKILNANINGFVFPIDEGAYEQLKMYLDQLRSGIQDAEVYQDIENRIAELFNYKLKTGKQAIFESDVNDIILQVGSVDELV